MLWKLLVTCLVVHLFLLYTTVEIFWTTTYVPEVQVSPGLSNPPAHRLVLIVFDGTRDDSFWRAIAERGGSLSNDVGNKGTFGEAVGSIPTTTKPGVIAITSGALTNYIVQTIYEFFGRPNRFPTVFDYATPSLFFGYTDVIGVFQWRNQSDPFYRTKVTKYENYMRHLTCDDPLIEAFNKIYHEANFNKTLNKILHHEKLAIYFHFGGTDYSGHYYGPTYGKTINVIIKMLDRVASISATLNNFYNDTKTVIIVTSDHGMTTAGTHGGGSWAELITPFIAMGSGVKNNRKKQQIRQTDLAPFMATLIGVPIPPNSVGRVPLAMLDLTPQQRAQAIANNAFQAATLASTAYSRLPTASHFLFVGTKNFSVLEKTIMDYMMQGNYSNAEFVSGILLDKAYSSFEEYEQFFKVISILCQLLIVSGWSFMCFCYSTLPRISKDSSPKKENPIIEEPCTSEGDQNLCCGDGSVENIEITLLEEKKISKKELIVKRPKKCALVIDIPFLIFEIMCLIFIIKMSVPYQTIIYVTFGFLLWRYNCLELYRRTKTKTPSRIDIKELFTSLLLQIAVSEYLYRSFLGQIPVCLIIGFVGLLPVYFNWEKDNKYATFWQIGLGGLTYLSAAAKQLGPKGGLIPLNVGGVFCVLITILSPAFVGASLADMIFAILLAALQALALGLMFAADSRTGWGSALGRNNNVTLPPLLEISLDILLVTSFIIAFAFGSWLWRRKPACFILHSASLLAIPLILLSTGLEPLSLLFLAFAAIAWLYLDSSNPGGFTDVRRAMLFCFLATTAYLASGNIASLTSFSIDWTRNIVRHHNEFKVGIVVFVKFICVFSGIVNPFIILSKARNANLERTILMVFCVLNFMATRSCLSLLTGKKIFERSRYHKITDEEPFDAIRKYCCVLLLTIFINLSFILNLYFYRLSRYKKNLET